MGVEAILDAVRALPIEDQRRLIAQIETDLQGDAQRPELTPDQAKEIKRRIAAFEADPKIAIPWSKAEKGIDQLLKELGE